MRVHNKQRQETRELKAAKKDEAVVASNYFFAPSGLELVAGEADSPAKV